MYVVSLLSYYFLHHILSFYLSSDLLVGFVSLMPDLLWRLAGHFYGGEVLCKIVKFSQVNQNKYSNILLVSRYKIHQTYMFKF